MSCCHAKVYHISTADYDDFVAIVLAARAAFLLTPGGLVQFNELVNSLKRQKSFTKQLESLVKNALQQNPMTAPPLSNSLLLN